MFSTVKYQELFKKVLKQIVNVIKSISTLSPIISSKIRGKEFESNVVATFRRANILQILKY